MAGILQDPSISPGGALNINDLSSPGFTIDPTAGQQMKVAPINFGPTAPLSYQVLPSGQGSNYMDPAPLDFGSQPDVSDVPAPDGPKKPGFWGKVSDPKTGISDGLLALGAGLLGGHNFFDGLSKGASAFSGAIDDARQRQAPTTQYLANGAVAAIRDPLTGKTTYQTNPNVLKAIGDVNNIKVQGQLSVQDSKNVASWQRAVLGDGTKVKIAIMQDGTRRYVADTGNETKKDIADNHDKTTIEAAKIGASSREDVANINGGYKLKAKNTPPKVLEDYTATQQGMSKTSIALQGLSDANDWLGDGSLKMGYFRNMINEGKLASGVGSDDESVKYGKFKVLLEQLRNGTLRLNKGVQTEGDAVRAANEILAGKGDVNAIRANLATVQHTLAESVRLDGESLKRMQNAYGVDGDDSGDDDSSPSPAHRASRTSAPRASGKSSTGVSWSISN